MVQTFISATVVAALILTFYAQPLLAANTLNLTVATDKTAYRPSTPVYVSGSLMWNNNPVPNAIVGVEVTDPLGNPLTFRTRPTGPIMTQDWLVNFTQFYPCDSAGVPKYSFQTASGIYVHAEWENFDTTLAHPVGTCISFYGANSVPIGFAFLYSLIPPTSSGSNTFSANMIPSSVVGNVTIYASLFSDFPKNGGYPYCMEQVATFTITTSQATSSSQEQKESALSLSQNGYYDLSFKIPSAGLGYGYCTVYSNTYYYATLLKDSTTFGLLGLLGDINGDSKVNILDAIQLANAFNSRPGNSNWNPNADLNSDNVVNILDAIIVANHFGQGG
jgi:hypothetical protein